MLSEILHYNTNVLITEKSFVNINNTVKYTMEELDNWFHNNGLLLDKEKKNIINFKTRKRNKIIDKSM